MSEVGIIVKYLPDCFRAPHMPCSAKIRLAELFVVVDRGYRHTVLIELISNVVRTVTNENALNAVRACGAENKPMKTAPSQERSERML